MNIIVIIKENCIKYETTRQQVVAVSSVVNGGNLLKPYIVKSISESETNSIVYENKKQIVAKTISKETSNTMRRALESVVARGGGKSAFIEGYRIGGKTGTAQKVDKGKYMVGNYIMSFMAILPANDPQVVLYLAIDNPKNTALLSSYTTTPIARRILLDIIDILDIPKQTNEQEKIPNWNDLPQYEVSNVIGLSLKEAKNKLANFKLKIVGKGEFIKDQSPKPGEKMEIGSTIKLLLGN